MDTPGVVRAEFASGVAVDQFFTLDLSLIHI